MLRETLKVAVVVVVVCGGMLWWSLGPHIERIARSSEVRASIHNATMNRQRMAFGEA